MKRKRMVVGLLFVFFILLSTGTASSNVITFENAGSSLSSQYGLYQLGQPYSDFAWDASWYAEVPASWYGHLTAGLAPDGGQWLAFRYNSSSLPATITSTASFTFNGAYFADLYGPEPDEYQLTIKGYRGTNSTPMYESTITVNEVSPVWFQADWTEINKVAIYSSSNSYWFTMDNFTYNETVVPLPPSALIFGTGLMGLAGIRWKVLRYVAHR